MQTAATFPTDEVIDLEHNCYHGFTASQFLQDTTGNHTFAAWLAEYPSQDQAATASVNSDPLFVNAADDDFRLQAGSPARNLAATIGAFSFSHAGAYQTGSEVIGLDDAEAAPASGFGAHPGALLAVF